MFALCLSLAVGPAVSAEGDDERAGEPEAGPLDAAHRVLTRRAEALARWIDAFFEDKTYVAEEADASARVRQSVAGSPQRDVEFRTGVRGRMTLPHASRRFSIEFEGDEEPAPEAEAEQEIVESVDDAFDRPSVALEYRPVRGRDAHAGFRVGLRTDPQLYAGPRFRFRHPVAGGWAARETLEVRWYTEDGWRPEAVFDLDRPIGSDRLFRQRLQVSWREDRRTTEGVRYNPTTSFTQALSDVAAMRYAWSSAYYTQPRAEWRASVLAVRYRRRVHRPWLYVEVAPFLAFERRFDWAADPGLQVTVEVVFEDEAITPRPARPVDGD